MILRAATGKKLTYKRIPLELYERNKRMQSVQPQEPKQPRSKAHKPKPNHPWRKEFSRHVDLNKAKKRGHSYVAN